jgi:hypothetical protein
MVGGGGGGQDRISLSSHVCAVGTNYTVLVRTLQFVLSVVKCVDVITATTETVVSLRQYVAKWHA